jgi:hypothetical protein
MEDISYMVATGKEGNMKQDNVFICALLGPDWRRA